LVTDIEIAGIARRGSGNGDFVLGMENAEAARACLRRPKNTCSVNAPSVEKIVDYFHPRRKRTPDFPLVNPCRILIGIATPYLSIDNMEMFTVAAGTPRSDRCRSLLGAFHSSI
jgi:hypothetical protein